MFISVIMPVYNNEVYFQNAVNSVLKQSFKDIELVIIDDGSTDQTPLIADEFAREDSRVKVIHQNNQWIYASFNNGIAFAEGEYVYILNSDDLLREGALELIGGIARRYRPDVVWTKVLSHICDEEQNVLTYDYSNTDRLVKQDLYCKGRNEVRKNWGYLFQSTLVANQANLYSRKLMLEHPFRNDIYGADVLFNISIASDIESFYVCRIPVYDFFIYDMSKGNTSRGRYYGYEHKMFNDFYQGYMELYRSWGIKDFQTMQIYASMRMKYVGVEIQALSAVDCPLETDEKVYKILAEYMDELVCNCAKEYNRELELEISVIAGLRGIFSRETLKPGDRMYFVKDMLDSMIRYEKKDADIEKIERGVKHELNPYRIGKKLLDRLKQSRGPQNRCRTKAGRLILYGAGNHGKTYLPLLQEEWDIIGFCDGNPDKADNSYCGKTVLSPEQLVKLELNLKVFITVASTEAREKIYSVLEKAGIDKKDILEDIL